MSRFPKSGRKEIVGQTIIYDMVDKIDDEGSLGECLADKNKIRILKGMKRDVMRSTVMHEEIEMINAKLDIGLEHKQINALETGLMSIKEVK